MAKQFRERDLNAEFDYPCAEAREFFAKEAGDIINESNIISSKTLADLFRGFDEKEKDKHQKG